MWKSSLVTKYFFFEYSSSIFRFENILDVLLLIFFFKKYLSFLDFLPPIYLDSCLSCCLFLCDVSGNQFKHGEDYAEGKIQMRLLWKDRQKEFEGEKSELLQCAGMSAGEEKIMDEKQDEAG